MKMDLKTLKDLRHDNLNSFIGACVEPATISVVTDYGTRGSLRCTGATPKGLRKMDMLYTGPPGTCWIMRRSVWTKCSSPHW